MNISDIRSMTDAIKELKQKYHISSNSAMKYLKEEKLWKDEWQRISQSFPSVALRFSEFVNLMTAAVEIIELNLNSATLESCQCSILKEENRLRRFGCSDSEWKTESEEDDLIIASRLYWNVNHRMLHESLFASFVKIEDFNACTLKHLRSALANAALKPLLAMQNDAGSAMSFRQAYKILVMRSLLMQSEGNREAMKKKFYYLGIPSEIWEEGLAAVEQYLIEEDVASHFSMEQEKNAMKNEIDEIACRVGTLGKRMCPFVHQYLYSDYGAEHGRLTRSEYEMTRGSLEVERRIALANFLSCWEEVLGESEEADVLFESAIEYALEKFQDRINECSQKLRDYLAMEAPAKMFKSQQRSLAGNRYIFVSLKKNKKWLRELFVK